MAMPVMEESLHSVSIGGYDSMIEVYQWALVFIATIVGAILLSLYLSDRYFGASSLGGLVRKKEVAFLEHQPLWINRILMFLVVTVLMSASGLWPISVFGFEFLIESLPYLLIFWGMMTLAILATLWNRETNGEIAADSHSNT